MCGGMAVHNRYGINFEVAIPTSILHKPVTSPDEKLSRKERWDSFNDLEFILFLLFFIIEFGAVLWNF